jgi:hypothetical protein
MNWIGLIKAIVDFLNSLFTANNNRKHEELGRLQEAQRQAEIEDQLVDTIRGVDPGVVSDDEAFGGPSSRDLPGTLPK